MLSYLSFQNCHKLKGKNNLEAHFTYVATAIFSSTLKKKYAFAGITSSLAPVLAPLPRAMKAAQSAPAFQVITQFTMHL